MKNIGLVSDLHLEGSNMSELVNPGWDYLVIGGDLSTDLGLTDQFLAYKAPQDIPIIYVLGNHEFEGRRFDQTLEMIRKVLKPYEHVTLLYDQSIIIDDIKFIGSTLWTNFELEGMHKREENMKWAKNNVADFTYIFTQKENGKYGGIDPEEMAEMSHKSMKFLEFELRQNPFDGDKVVVTHFAPHPLSIDPNYKRGNSSYWINNLEELMGFSRYWLHGHTHSSFRYEVEGTEVVCNPRGFSKTMDLSPNPKFDRQLILPIGLENNLDNKFKIRK